LRGHRDRADTEVSIRQRGFRCLAGVDEAGRGALAGPVVAAAVVLRDGRPIPGVTDSKRLNHEQREFLYARIAEEAVAVGVGVVDVPVIEACNILRATLLAMEEAVTHLTVPPEGIVVDGMAVPEVGVPAFAVPGGDRVCPSVSAASIVAKVTRDRIMARYHRAYPSYGFDRHKGYGTAAHLRAIAAYGMSPIHRKTFAPLRQTLPLGAGRSGRC
jgi:ribonuclease HII